MALKKIIIIKITTLFKGSTMQRPKTSNRHTPRCEKESGVNDADMTKGQVEEAQRSKG